MGVRACLVWGNELRTELAAKKHPAANQQPDDQTSHGRCDGSRGYEQQIEEVVGEVIFEEQYENMVLARDVESYSLCEHMVPFFGRGNLAYTPDGESSACRSFHGWSTCL